MIDKTLGAAVTRLERAIARLERARGLPHEGIAPDPLEQRHDRLRRRVSETVARLDALIVASENAG